MALTQRPTKQVWIDRFEPLEVWRFAFRLENVLLAAPLILIWSFLLGSYYTGGLIMVARSLGAIYLTLAFFFCYLFIILDFTSRGYQAPPKLSGDLLTTNKLRFIKSLAVASLFASLIYATSSSPVLLGLMVTITFLFLPVSLCVIAIQDTFLNALNPLTWLVFFRDIEFDKSVAQYFLILGLTVAIGSLLMRNFSWFNLLTVTAVVFSVILLFRSLGVVLHTHASTLGLSVRFGPQVEARQVAESERRALSDFGLSLYQQVEVNRIEEAWENYQQHITANKFADEGALWDIIQKWQNVKLALLAGQGYIERLLNQQRSGEAWNVLRYCYESNQSEYRLASGDTTLRMADNANSSQERIISAELLRYFDKDFPGHPSASDALLRAIEIMLIDTNDITGARKLLNHIRIKFPESARTRVYLKLEAAVTAG
ncbi:MAG: hypothetical protein ACI82A_002979 [Candidatus Azotimanducaceae bacterium]|jgi:hypothetical protein